MSVVALAKALAVQAYHDLRGGRGRFAWLKEDTARAFPSALPSGLCMTLRQRIDVMIDSGEGDRIWRDAQGADVRILGVERDIGPDLAAFDIPAKIAEIEAYTGRAVRSWTLMANRITAVPGNRGSGGGLHRDSPFSPQVKCIWYLSDVTEDNGPFQYVSGTHKGLVRDRRSYPLGTYRFDRIDHPLTSVTGPAGTLLVCDTRCIHGGKPIAEGTRHAVTLYTFYDPNGVKRLFRASGVDETLAPPRTS